MRHYLSLWLLCTCVACVFVYTRARLELAALPDTASTRWAYDALEAARRGAAIPPAPPSARAYHSSLPMFVSVYVAGRRLARHVQSGSFPAAVAAAAQRFAADPELRALPSWSAPSPDELRFRVAVTRATGPLMAAVPGLRAFSLVPLRDGIEARHGEHVAYLTPDDLQEQGLTDRAVVAPVPDLTFGTDLDAAYELLAPELDLPAAAVRKQASLARIRVDALPQRDPNLAVVRSNLLQAAREGVEFVLRHQAASGKFTYVYDAQHDEAVDSAAYNLARHSGTIFFLARAARELKLPAARAAALQAIEFLGPMVASCGASDRSCIVQADRMEFGASALTALACAELLRGGDNPQVRTLLAGLLGFLRAQQRADGELMHGYDREAEQPIDVQYMYYSGEGAMALLAGYEQLHDARDLEVARRVMGHLTGAGWGFFGARYYYGEEHWTCQAVGKAAAHMQVTAALDFCLRWGRWQERLQYQPGQTPWKVAGAFGVSPVLVPRVTTASSRVEALVPIYRVAKQRGYEVQGIRRLVEQSLGLLLRMRWAPGPAHLFARPAAAVGGIPSTAADLRSRVDMVQHAGSAMLAWAEQLAAEP